MGVIRQEPIVGFLNDNRIFYVNLNDDATYSYTWRNGEVLTEDEIKSYCIQIASAQEKLETIQNYILRGRGMPQYGFWDWPYSKGKSGVSTDNVKYYKSGKVDGNNDNKNCRIKNKADLRQ